MLLDPDARPSSLRDTDIRPALASGYEAFELQPWTERRRLFGFSDQGRGDGVARLAGITLGFGEWLKADHWISVETCHSSSSLAEEDVHKRARSIAWDRNWYRDTWAAYGPVALPDDTGHRVRERLESDGFVHVGANGPVNSYVRTSPAGSVIVVHTIGDLDVPELRVVTCEDVDPYYVADDNSTGM